MCLRLQRRSRCVCDAHEHWREAMAFPSGLVAAVFLPPTHSRRGEWGDWPKEGERVRRVAVVLRLCVSASLRVPVPCPSPGCVSCVCSRGRERELGVRGCVRACVRCLSEPARVGWVALVVDDRPVWDRGTSVQECSVWFDN